MHLLLLPASFSGETSYILRGDNFHHLVHVERRKEGDAVPAMDASGGRYEARIGPIRRDYCILFLKPQSGEAGAQAGSDDCPIRLYQCIPKGKTMDTVVRQAVEAGVRDIIPVVSRYTIPDYAAKDMGKKTIRWQGVADEAVKQCGAAFPVRLRDIIHIHDIEPVPEQRREGLGLVFHEKKVSDTTLHGLLSEKTASISIVIGPEGGLSEEELEILQKKGYHALHLGPRILKVDTAALVAIACVQLILLEKKSWNVPS